MGGLLFSLHPSQDISFLQESNVAIHVNSKPNMTMNAFFIKKIQSSAVRMWSLIVTQIRLFTEMGEIGRAHV